VTFLFYVAAIVAVVATLLVVTRSNLVHALLYLIVSLTAVAVVFYTLGAPFVAALEVIIYAGAIMMLFVFAVILLDLRSDEAKRAPARAWIGPAILGVVLLVELTVALASSHSGGPGTAVPAQRVGETLFGPYVIGVELASMLLLAALVGARHVADRRDEPDERGAPGSGPSDGATQ
jgi:NADH-quinone oxidoreductase subunit J